MLMAQAQLGVGYVKFLDRLVKAVTVRDYLIGVLKAPVFAAIIVVDTAFSVALSASGL
jgi:ABC-type transporter Mla maintaining outer membrane lipid asymmetry permease subunit MlaE